MIGYVVPDFYQKVFLVYALIMHCYTSLGRHGVGLDPPFPNGLNGFGLAAKLSR
jgi:hypothetical protein